MVDSPALAHYVAGTWAAVVAALADQVGATAVAAASTTFSRDFLPRVAARLGAGMVSETVAIVDATKFKRPMWAGNVVATVEVKTPKAVFSVRATEFALAEPAGAAPVQAVAIAVSDDGKARFANFAPTISARLDLGEAKVIVSGGRGLRDKDGWKTLDPSLYFAIGLSGAIQHVAGMKNSKVIVAINKDSEAPIFSIADYGLVADAFKAVPELIDEIKRVRA